MCRMCIVYLLPVLMTTDQSLYAVIQQTEPAVITGAAAADSCVVSNAHRFVCDVHLLF